MTQRQVEIFVAGCPRCYEAVNLVQQMSCTACQIQVWDVRSEQITATARQKLEDYGIHRLPAVVVDGELVDCCRQQQPISRDALAAAGVGRSK
ncbi:MAG: glutaredoxin [Leptolyngbya sp.]|jgi:hypothetical protein|nr:MAG: glutaredoxin [Leptolyngbya sp.]